MHKALSILAVITLISFAIIYLMVFKAPLFVDDAHWPIQSGRVLFDSLKMISLYPQCTSNFVWTVGWPLLPGRIFTSLVHPENLISIRISGMAKYLVCIGLLSGIAYWLFEKKVPFLLFLGSTAALLSIGFLPVIMTLNRPETSIVIGSLLLVACTLISKQYNMKSFQPMCWVMAYLAVTSWLLSMHPKTQALIPAIWLLAYSASLPSRKIKILIFVGLIAISIASIQLWRTHSDCLDYPNVETMLKNYSVVPDDLQERPVYFKDKLMENLKRSPERYLPAYAHSEKYLGFMPQAGHPNQANRPLLLFTNYVNLSLLVCLFYTMFIASVFHLKDEFKLSWKPVSWKWLLPLALFLPVVVIVLMRQSFSVTKETGMFICFFWFALIWYAAANGWHHRFRKTIITLCGIIMLCGILNHIAFYQGWHGFFEYTGNPKNFRHGHYAHDPYNRLQAIFDSPQRNQELLKLAGRCNIKPDNTTHHLVVDDWTYMPFYKTFQPFYGRTLFQHGVPGNDFITFLRQTDSDGVVALCSNLPQQLRPLAINQDGLCCISKERLNQ